MTDTHRYPAQLFWSETDKGFIAVAPDLPGCSAFGETQHDALDELQDAIQAWMEAARTAGNPIPEPASPAADHQHRGKVLVRMPRRLHTQLAHAAKQEDVSLNQYIVYLLASAGSARGSAPSTTPKRSTSTVA